MQFTPENRKEQEIPYYDDVTAEDGWKGHETEKSITKLQSEIKEVVGRLGGTVTTFTRGKYVMDSSVSRDGFLIEYIVPIENGGIFKGRISVAALPVRSNNYNWRTVDKRKEKSLRMALFNVRDALDGARILQILSPGYVALVPFMLGNPDQTISQIWAENATIKALMPPGDADFIEGEEI